jgi:hypothetical protein
MPKRVQENTLNHAEVMISFEGELRACVTESSLFVDSR